MPEPMSGPGPEMWDAGMLRCPYCHALVLAFDMAPHDQWHILIARLLKEAGAAIELRA